MHPFTFIRYTFTVFSSTSLARAHGWSGPLPAVTPLRMHPPHSRTTSKCARLVAAFCCSHVTPYAPHTLSAHTRLVAAFCRSHAHPARTPPPHTIKCYTSSIPYFNTLCRQAWNNGTVVRNGLIPKFDIIHARKRRITFLFLGAPLGKRINPDTKHRTDNIRYRTVTHTRP